ncbi:TPA: hypothetical protein HA332_08680 [Sulfurisphaera tokodaii]|uniref:Uncharacterized protein n=2 Tax=Sulfurisphaera tokodaii TaxID=111955 RepID=A0A832TRV7_9CREN|nr:hypothetical protein [Sulfurisphaera tokodaii]
MKSYSNPFIIGLRTIFGKYPFEAKLKGHEKVVITSRVYKITSYYAFLYLARKKVKN